VALSECCADVTGPKALRASMGAVFRVPLARFDEAPGRRVALVSAGGEPLTALALDGPVTFVLGSERDGLPTDVIAACDDVCSIPLAPGAESLNVSAAGAIALHELVRGRR
jgi:RNA methyltransferase, TrmH family